MTPPRWQWLRDFIADPIPRRKQFGVSSWVQWRLRMYRLRVKPHPITTDQENA